MHLLRMCGARLFRCPAPPEWARVYKQLLDIHRSRAGSSADEPPSPLILNGWVFSSPREKHNRWLSTVEWAQSHDCLDIIESVSPDSFVNWDRDVPSWDPGADAPPKIL